MTTVIVVTSSALSRREFIIVGASTVCAFAGGCGDTPTSGDLPGVEITEAAVVIPLAAVPALDRDGGSYVVRAASVIVLNLGAGAYRAFSNVCTHAGCGVDRFERSRMICPCHGSEYDTSGVNVEGPAPEPLRRLALMFDSGLRVIRIERRPM